MYLLLLFPTVFCGLLSSSRVGTSFSISTSTQFFNPVQELHRADSIKSCNHSIVLLLLHFARYTRRCKFIHFSTSSSDCSSRSSIRLMIISSKAERTRGYRANGRRHSSRPTNTAHHSQTRVVAVVPSSKLNRQHCCLFGCAGFVSSLHLYFFYCWNAFFLQCSLFLLPKGCFPE